MRKMIRRLLLGATVVLLGGAATGCTNAAPVDEIGLYYNGGPLEGNSFDRVVNPGSGSIFLGYADNIKWLPVGQRNYIVSKQSDEGDRAGVDFIQVPAKGGVVMDFEVSVYFKLNTSTEPIKVGEDDDYDGGILRRFWEQIGKKYGADGDDGWDQMLNDNFRKQIEAAMRQKVFNYTVDELFANEEGEASGDQDAILLIQEDIARSLKENINRNLGGDYFCGPTFDRNKPDECPDFQFVINSAVPATEAVRNSFDAQRVAANEVVTAENKAKAKKAEAEGVRAAQDALRGSLTPDYIGFLEAQAMQECAKRPECTLIFSSGGAGVNVNTRPPTG